MSCRSGAAIELAQDGLHDQPDGCLRVLLPAVTPYATPCLAIAPAEITALAAVALPELTRDVVPVNPESLAS